MQDEFQRDSVNTWLEQAFKEAIICFIEFTMLKGATKALEAASEKGRIWNGSSGCSLEAGS